MVKLNGIIFYKECNNLKNINNKNNMLSNLLMITMTLKINKFYSIPKLINILLRKKEDVGKILIKLFPHSNLFISQMILLSKGTDFYICVAYAVVYCIQKKVNKRCDQKQSVCFISLVKQ
jgi:hypothetical protein